MIFRAQMGPKKKPSVVKLNSSPHKGSRTAGLREQQEEGSNSGLTHTYTVRHHTELTRSYQEKWHRPVNYSKILILELHSLTPA